MKVSNKGYKTRQRILETAKELFYENSYTTTRITEICNLADVKLGTFTYYFKTKEVLVSEIYAEFLTKVYTYVSYTEARRMNSLEGYVMSTFLMNKVIFSNEQNIKFHHEVLTNLTINSILGNSLKRVYTRINQDFQLNFDENELKKVSAADLGVQRELILSHIEKQLFESPTDLFKTVYLMTGRLFKLDEQLVQDYIDEAIAFQLKNDFSHIKFLV